MKSVIRWLWRIFLSLFLVLVLFLSVIILFKIPINLSGFKEPVEVLASEALGRKVAIEGSVVISTSLSPVFTMEGLNIASPEGFLHESFMDLDKVRIQLDLLPLLRMKLHIPELSVKGLQVTLEQNSEGKGNWTFDKGDNGIEGAAGKQPAEKQEQQGEGVKEKPEIASDSIVIEKLELDDIQLSLYRHNVPEPASFQIENCKGAMLPGTPLQLDLHGTLQTYPFSVELAVASLEEFLKESRSWMEIQAELAETYLTFSGNVNLSGDDRSLALKTEVRGEHLQSLSGLLKVDLPPFAAYKVATDLEVRPGQFKLNNLKVATGESSLVGTADVIKNEGLVSADVTFHSPLIQLDDFLFDDWKWSAEEEEAIAEEQAEGESTPADAEEKEGKNGDSGEKIRKLMDPDVLNKFNLQLHVQADQVLSGEDPLGNGLLKASLIEGRIAVAPLELNVPGGSITMSASLKPGRESSDATLRAVMKNFDIGILVRRTKPDAKMSGLVNLDVDLRSSAATPKDILANGNGYFDFSGQLDNLSAGIIDLWAVNLIAAIVSRTEEEQSQLNCAVARWSVVDGILSPDVFVIDTSKIRICGKGQVDFGEQHIDLTVSPTAKKPEFFNLATPLRVNGSFEDINYGVKQGAVVGTALRFITSPVHVPLRRLVSDSVPEDGSDVCSIPLGPDNRTPESIKACR